MTGLEIAGMAWFIFMAALFFISVIAENWGRWR